MTRNVMAQLGKPTAFNTTGLYQQTMATFSTEQQQPPPSTVDSRIPRYFKNKIVCFGIPQSITKEQFLEHFKEFGATDETMNF